MKILLVSSTTTDEENRKLIQSSKPEFIHFPTVEFKPIRKKPIDLTEYEWLIISSRKVYDFLLPLVRAKELKKVKIAVGGEATARYLKKKNLRASFVSSTFTGEDFGREFCLKYPKIRGKILRPISSFASPEMENILKKNGFEVDSIPIYEPLCPGFTQETINTIREGVFDFVLFTSPSTWENFKIILGNDYRNFLNGKRIGVIGPTTAKAVEKDGYREYIMPEKFTLAELIKKIEGEKQ